MPPAKLVTFVYFAISSAAERSGNLDYLRGHRLAKRMRPVAFRTVRKRRHLRTVTGNGLLIGLNNSRPNIGLPIIENRTVPLKRPRAHRCHYACC
jgi:hypothetical protein